MTSMLPGTIIDTQDYASQGNAVLGIRDSGKSYLATLLGEKLMDAAIPFTAFDPIGIWRFLRVPGRGAGYPVVVAGGEHGDLPLTPEGAPEIVRAAMREGVSLVIDLYSMKLSKADWRRIVEHSVRVLLYENKGHGLRHVFIEEAAEFAPQIVGRDYGHVYAEIEKLARMGGNALLGYTLISQRAEQVNKAVLELCDSLFLFRQKGRLSLTALSKWLGIADAKGGAEIISSLPTLPQGVCWVWPAGTDAPVKVKVPTKRTFHPDRRALHGGTPEAIRQAVDVGVFVSTMRASLASIEAEAQANDPKLLKRRIAELERQAKAPAPAVTIDEAAIDRAYVDGLTTGEEAAGRFYRGRLEDLKTTAAQLAGIATQLQANIDNALNDRAAPKANGHAKPARALPAPALRPVVRKSAGAGETMPGPQRKLLTVLAQYPQGRTKKQLAILAGYAHSGGAFNNPLANLRSRGWAEGGPARILATQAGLDALGSWEPLPEGPDLREYWFGNLDGPPAKLLRALCEVYPDGLPKDELARRCGYEPSGGAFNNPLARLRSLELAHGRGGAEIRASDDLF